MLNCKIEKEHFSDICKKYQFYQDDIVANHVQNVRSSPSLIGWSYAESVTVAWDDAKMKKSIYTDI